MKMRDWLQINDTKKVYDEDWVISETFDAAIRQGFQLATPIQMADGDDQGWFVAYGPYDNPTIAIAVVVEQGGYGADSAAPIARKIMEAAFDLPPSRDAADIYAEELTTKQSSIIAPPEK
jgi:cell division protein FtsI/penicillin-binding protein 2